MNSECKLCGQKAGAIETYQALTDKGMLSVQLCGDCEKAINTLPGSKQLRVLSRIAKPGGSK